MKIGLLIVLVCVLLAGCSTMNGFVEEEGVGLQLNEKKPMPTGVFMDTTTSKPFVEPLPPENNPSWDVF